MGAVSLAMGLALLGMIQERTAAKQTILPAQEQQAESQLEEPETTPQPTPEPVRRGGGGGGPEGGPVGL